MWLKYGFSHKQRGMYPSEVSAIFSFDHGGRSEQKRVMLQYHTENFTISQHFEDGIDTHT
jgi:hypothetical protein